MSNVTIDRLRELFKQKALKFGDFTLSSGVKSTYYVNSKKVLFHSEAISLLGRVLYDNIKDLEPALSITRSSLKAVGGLEVGAIPMTAALLQTFHKIENKPLEGFFVRKTPKKHGSRELIEGAELGPGDKVVIVDDVLTTGNSALQAIQAVEEVGAEVVRVVCICDRLQGAGVALAKYDFKPIFTIHDFGIEPTQPEPQKSIAESLKPALAQTAELVENMNKVFARKKQEESDQQSQGAQ